MINDTIIAIILSVLLAFHYEMKLHPLINVINMVFTYLIYKYKLADNGILLLMLGHVILGLSR